MLAEPLAPEPKLIPRPLAVAATLLVLGLFLTVGGGSQLINVGIGLWFTEIFIFLGVGWVLLGRRGLKPAVATGLLPARPAQGAFGFALGVANFFALVVPIQWAAQSLVPPAWREAFDSSQIFEGQSSIELGIIVLGVSLAAPVCEEFFFRGILQQGLLPPAFSPARAVTITAFVFSAFHLDPVGFLARVELGVLFGLLFLRTGSLWPSIGAHAANNLVSTVLFFVTQETAGAQGDAPEGRVVAGFSLMGLAVLWALASAARKSASWCPEGQPDAAAAVDDAPERPWSRLVAPWLGGLAALAGLLLLLDLVGAPFHWMPSRPK